MTEETKIDKEALKNLTVNFETFKKVYQIAKRNKLKTIRFEFIVGSCFPEIMKNIKTELATQYTKGYAEGLKDGKAGVE